MANLELESLTKRYPGVVSVDAISLSVEHGEFVCLLGPSGCGKTTTLRMIAGFLEPDGGEIRVGGKVVSSVRSVVPPERRNMSMIFQSYAVWPHMTVRQNVGYGAEDEVDARRRNGRARTDVAARGDEAHARRPSAIPSELSGGQQQRVALARALAPKPDILLLDEPLSNLDANLRGDMRFEIRRLHDEFQYTSIYVTHDQVEAMTMADRIVVMNAGRIEQIGTPEDVYERPEFRVRRALHRRQQRAQRDARWRDARCEVAGHTLDIGQGEFAGARRADELLRQDARRRAAGRTTAPARDNTLPGVVRSQAYLGSHRDYIVDVGQDVLIAAPADLAVPNGSKVSGAVQGGALPRTCQLKNVH